jgi:hypothetical protein
MRREIRNIKDVGGKKSRPGGAGSLSQPLSTDENLKELCKYFYCLTTNIAASYSPAVSLEEEIEIVHGPGFLSEVDKAHLRSIVKGLKKEKKASAEDGTVEDSLEQLHIQLAYSQFGLCAGIWRSGQLAGI